jgi:hypothetical protein
LEQPRKRVHLRPQPGNLVQFDFPYFASSGVMAVLGNGVIGALQGGERLALNHYDNHKKQ